MSLAQNIFTTTEANETNFIITWTPPYYMSTSAVKAEVDDAPWTVVAVAGTAVTLETGIPAGSTVRIYRNTDITDNEVNFLPGSPFRAEDINANFDQILFSLQENVTINENQDIQIDIILDSINDLLELINNSIQYVPLADVDALNDEALTDPDNLKTYEIVNSTNIDTLANPIIVNLPPTAGGGAGQDPVNGVYWNDGIITRVSWDKPNQQWLFLFYYPKDSDNRYQQITLTDPITPDPSDYKDGTLWFDSGEANLYVLYNDGNSRQWVITNPLSAYGQIVTTDDVYWSRSGNTVYPKNASDTVANNATATGWSITSEGNVSLNNVSGNEANFDTVNATTSITSAAINGGTVSGSTGTFTGDVSGVNGSFTGDVSGVNGSFSATVSGVDGSFTGDVSGQNATFTGAISGVSADITGTITCDGISVDGQQLSNVVVSTPAIDCSLGNYYTSIVNGNISITFSNVPTGCYSLTIEVQNNSGTITWPASVKWPEDTVPELTTGKTHLFVLVTDDGGSKWRAGSLINYTT